ncbi:MAG TPA: hypothetical protein PLE74_02110 [Candidatus Cloacimonadota bacterium]|nr:hypothetical protein [Candidatus Cloacimonadota bacterium]
MDESTKGFFSVDENAVSTLGQGYWDSFLRGEGLTKLVMVLTNKRLYIKGKVIILGKSKATIDEDINVADISGTGFYIYSRAFLRTILALIGIIGEIILILAIINEHESSLMPLAVAGAAFFILITMLCKDIRHISIFVKGNKFIYPIKSYSIEDVMKFRQSLSNLIEMHRNK